MLEQGPARQTSAGNSADASCLPAFCTGCGKACRYYRLGYPDSCRHPSADILVCSMETSNSPNMALQPDEGRQTNSFPSGGDAGDILPDEIPFGVTRMEYDILRSGEINASKAGRDCCLGFLGSAVIGLIGLITQVEWGAAFRQTRLAPFIWAAVLFAVVLASACGALIQHRNCNRDNRPYYALMARLRRYFEEQDPSSV